MSDTLTEVCEDFLAQILANDDLVAFLVGEQPYFIESHSDEGGPRDMRRAIERCLLPCWQGSRFPYLLRHFTDTLLKILAAHLDHGRAIYVVQNWIQYYRFCLPEKRASPQGPYDDLSEVGLSTVAVTLKRQLEVNKNGLIRSTHWAGTTQNSSNGLWDPLLRTSTAVRDKLDGPGFVPDTP